MTLCMLLKEKIKIFQLKKTSLGMHFWPLTGLNANSEELIYQVKLS